MRRAATGEGSPSWPMAALRSYSPARRKRTASIPPSPPRLNDRRLTLAQWSFANTSGDANGKNNRTNYNQELFHGVPLADRQPGPIAILRASFGNGHWTLATNRNFWASCAKKATASRSVRHQIFEQRKRAATVSGLAAQCYGWLPVCFGGVLPAAMAERGLSEIVPR